MITPKESNKEERIQKLSYKLKGPTAHKRWQQVSHLKSTFKWYTENIFSQILLVNMQLSLHHMAAHSAHLGVIFSCSLGKQTAYPQ